LDVSKDYLPEPPAVVALLAEQAIREKHLAVFTKLDAAVRARAAGGEAAVSLQFLKAQALVAPKQDRAALALLTPLLAATAHPWAARIQALHKALAGMQGKA